MSKTNAYETSVLGILFNATAIANVADNAATAPLTSLYVSLHTATPDETGNQQTNECTYTSYARVAVARTSGGWTITGNSVSPTANITFPAATGGIETATHFGIGSDATGTGNLYYYGTVTPNISISSGVTPVLTTASAGTED
jgi:hypothetical protein